MTYSGDAEPCRDHAQRVAGRVLHGQQVGDELLDEVVTAQQLGRDVLGLAQRGDGLVELEALGRARGPRPSESAPAARPTAARRARLASPRSTATAISVRSTLAGLNSALQSLRPAPSRAGPQIVKASIRQAGAPAMCTIVLLASAVSKLRRPFDPTVRSLEGSATCEKETEYWNSQPR
jgi:hypothetical protein